jgi:hypothetical protein
MPIPGMGFLLLLVRSRNKGSIDHGEEGGIGNIAYLCGFPATLEWTEGALA